MRPVKHRKRSTEPHGRGRVQYPDDLAGAVAQATAASGAPWARMAPGSRNGHSEAIRCIELLQSEADSAVPAAKVEGGSDAGGVVVQMSLEEGLPPGSIDGREERADFHTKFEVCMAADRVDGAKAFTAWPRRCITPWRKTSVPAKSFFLPTNAAIGFGCDGSGWTKERHLLSRASG